MPNVYGQLIRAQLENKATDYTAGVRGLLWWNTANLKIMSDDGTNVRALLRNDQSCIFGNNGTANSNIRLNRAAAAVLQFVLGGDTTAEGSLSTSLAQTSSRVENYPTGSLPAFGNAGRLLWDTTTTSLKVDNGAAIKELALLDLAQTLTNKTYDTNSNTFKATGASATSVLQADGSGNTSWVIISGSLTAPNQFLNGSLTTSVAANAMTIALKDNAGADPSSGSPVKIAFRNSTAATGTFVVRSVTGALSIVVSSGATLGHVSATDCYIYVYALDNAGTVELAVIGSRYDVDPLTLQSTTIMSGTATDWNTLYSTTARSSKAIAFLGRIKSNQATAGTYASNSTEISLFPGYMYPTTSSWKSDLTFTASAGFGTIANSAFQYKKIGDSMRARVTFQCGTVAGSSGYLQLPSGYTIDYSKISSSARGEKVGTISRITSSSTGSLNFTLYVDGSTSNRVFLCVTANADGSFANDVVTAQFGTSEGVQADFEVPIKEWRSY